MKPKTLFFSNLVIGLLLLVLLPLKAYEQSSCQSAVTIVPGFDCSTHYNFNFSGQEGWYKFLADTNLIIIQVINSDSLPAAAISNFTLFSGTCQSLNAVAYSDSNLTIEYDNLIKNNYYYVKFEKSGLSDEWITFKMCWPLTWGIDSYIPSTNSYHQAYQFPDPSVYDLGPVCVNDPITFSENYYTWNEISNGIYYLPASNCTINFSIISGNLTPPIPSSMSFTTTQSYWGSPSQFTTIFSQPGSYYLYWSIVNPNVASQTMGPFLITVVDINPGAKILGPNNTCSEATYTVELSNPNYTYTWSVDPPTAVYSIVPGAPGSATVDWKDNIATSSTLSVLISNNGACHETLTRNIFPCCKASGTPAWANETITGTHNYTNTNTNILINGDVYLDGDITLSQSNSYQSQINFGPEARLIVMPGHNLLIEGNVVLQAGCEYMWDGIYTEDQTASVLITQGATSYKPLVRDAYNAIVSKGGGVFRLSNTDFIDNLIGVKATQYYQGSPPNYSYPHQGAITGCTFDVSGPNYTLQVSPYVGSYALCGIYVDEVNGLVLGDDLNITNDFAHMKIGLQSVNSSVEVYNNNFSHIPVVSSLTYPPDVAGVHATLIETEIPYFAPTLKVGITSASTNTFNDCQLGVFSNGYFSSIQGNRFIDCPKDVFCLEPGYPTSIESNIISSTQNLDMVGTAITVESAMTGSTFVPHFLDITHNEISGVQNGIWIVNQSGYGHNAPYLNENQIIFKTIDAEKPLPRAGINVEYSWYSQIFQNTVDFPYNIPDIDQVEKVKGLRISRTENASVGFNTFTLMGSGIFTNGENYVTQFYCNTLDNCYHGFYFGDGTALSDQGRPDIWNTHNRWLGTYNINNGQFKVSTNPGPPSNWVGPSINWYEYKLSPDIYQLDANIDQQSHPCHDNIYPVNNVDVNSCSFEYGFMEIADTTERSEKLGKYLEGSNQYQESQDQYLFYEKSFLYNLLINDPSIINMGGSDDKLYQNVVDSLSTTDIGTIESINALITQCELDSALLKNESLTDDKDWLRYRKTVDEIYIQTWARRIYTLNAADSAALMDIALLTPYVGGSAVYTARVMLNMNPEDYNIPYKAPISHGQHSNNELLIFPNPANDVINIEIPDFIEGNYQLEFYSTMGNLVYSLDFSSKTSPAKLNIKAIRQGFYFLKLRSGSKILGTSKLCIIK